MATISTAERAFDAAGVQSVRVQNRFDGAPTSVTRFPNHAQANLPTVMRPTVLGEEGGTTSPAGDVKNWVEYDKARRLSRAGRAGAFREYSYDAGERLIHIQEPDGTSWSFDRFESHEEPQRITYPDGSPMDVE